MLKCNTHITNTESVKQNQKRTKGAWPKLLKASVLHVSLVII